MGSLGLHGFSDAVDRMDIGGGTQIGADFVGQVINGLKFASHDGLQLDH